MRFVSTRAARPCDTRTIAPGHVEGRHAQGVPSESSDATASVSLKTALIEGLAPDGGLYVPEAIDPWPADELARLPQRTLTEAAYRALRPFTRAELDPTAFEAVLAEALNFPIPLVEVEEGVYALELFHGPTLAFKDIGARVMARLMAALDDGAESLTVLTATSGDTGGAVAHAFYGVPHTRVVVLYPDGRVSATQEAQLTMFNGRGANVQAYAIAGTFDDCQRLTKEAFADTALRRRMRLTSANSINIGRLLPQMVYYFHAVGQLRCADVVVSTPSGNFGNLTAGVMAKRIGLPIARFIAATNVNDVVPAYLDTGRFEPRRSTPTLANAMDVGNPSNFERMLWLYSDNGSAGHGAADTGHDGRDAAEAGPVRAERALARMRREIVGSRHEDDEVRATIRRVYEARGYLMDPHSAIAYLGLTSGSRASVESGTPGIFLATAHPAKFAEIVEPIIGRAIEKPAPLADALAQPRHIARIDATLDALKEILRG